MWNMCTNFTYYLCKQSVCIHQSSSYLHTLRLRRKSHLLITRLLPIIFSYLWHIFPTTRSSWILKCAVFQVSSTSLTAQWFTFSKHCLTSAHNMPKHFCMSKPLSAKAVCPSNKLPRRPQCRVIRLSLVPSRTSLASLKTMSPWVYLPVILHSVVVLVAGNHLRTCFQI